jgi:protein-S-isoprenylcysteine O-methyltransferase Ste14
LLIPLIWIAWFVSWMAAARWSNPTVGRPPARREVLYRIVVIIGALLLFGLYRHQLSFEITLWDSGEILGWSMVVLAILGFAFVWWARITLGRLWSSTVARKTDHHIVEKGPYAVVRHPIYTGVIVAALATAVQRGTGLAFVGFAVMTYGWYIKARLEENFLKEQLGREQYEEYARRVPMLVPFLRF